MQLVETQIENGLQVLDQREIELRALAESMAGLTIKDPNDKEGYLAVRAKRLEAKKARVSVENDAYNLREKAIKFSKTVISREKQLVGIVKPGEDNLAKEEDKWDVWQEEIRVAKEREEKARVQARVEKLAKFNYAIDLYDVTVMPDDKFNELLTQVEIDYNHAQEVLAIQKAEKEEIEKQERAEAERLKREEEERLSREAARLEAIRKEQEAKEAQIRADQEVMERELAVERQRQHEEFQKREAALKAQREQAEKEQRDREAKIEADRKALEAEKAEIKRLQDIKDAEEKARKEEAERIEREAKEKEEAELLAAQERMRQEALKPDKEKIFGFCFKIGKVMTDSQPTLSELAAKQLHLEYYGKLADLLEEFGKKANAL